MVTHDEIEQQLAELTVCIESLKVANWEAFETCTLLAELGKQARERITALEEKLGPEVK